MGAVTRICLTGATGFVGSAVLKAARARGLEVVAVHRSAPPAAWQDDAGIHPLEADLSTPAAKDILRGAMTECDAVIHAAAHLGGDPWAIAGDTVMATTSVLSGMDDSAAHLVLVSSIAVYDIRALFAGDAMDESTAVQSSDAARDPYSAGKCAQEEAVRAWGGPAWILRPGAVYGPGRTWHALMGFWASKLHVQIGHGGALPMVHVDHLARSLVEAAVTAPAGQAVLNVVDDDLPDRGRYLAAHRRLAGWPRFCIPVPFALWQGLARLCKPVSAHLPGLLREDQVRARLMPLHYPNAALRKALGGQDEAPFEDMLARSLHGSGP